MTQFKGCYNPRPVKGTNYYSLHAYGLACDFNNTRFSKEFVEVWVRNGWCYGGYFTRPDNMHFSYGKLEC